MLNDIALPAKMAGAYSKTPAVNRIITAEI